MRLIRAHNPDLIVSDLPGRDGGARRAAAKREARTSPSTRRSPISPACSSGPTRGSTCTSSPIPSRSRRSRGIAGPGSVRWAKPPTSPAFLAARSRDDARRALGLPDRRHQGDRGVRRRLGRRRPRSARPAPRSQVPDAIVLCLCGRNDKLRARVARAFGGEPRLRIMGFTDRMGDVLAAADALVHSSAGLTVLEAIIRGCPVISYGFGVRPRPRVEHRRSSASGWPRSRATSATSVPRSRRALEHRPEPDGSFARRPSTAALILSDERRARQLPDLARADRSRRRRRSRPRSRSPAWTLTDRRLVHPGLRLRPHTPVTAVATDRPEVGVLVDAPAQRVPTIAGDLSRATGSMPRSRSARRRCRPRTRSSTLR